MEAQSPNPMWKLCRISLRGSIMIVTLLIGCFAEERQGQGGRGRRIVILHLADGSEAEAPPGPPMTLGNMRKLDVD